LAAYNVKYTGIKILKGPPITQA